jgi:hypothetical protein
MGRGWYGGLLPASHQSRPVVIFSRNKVKEGHAVLIFGELRLINGV